MPTNVLLSRWAKGWAETVDAASVSTHGRKEAMLAVGAAQTETEVERIALEQLVVYADPREAITAEVAPVDETDTPYLAFGVGDVVTVPDAEGAPVAERVIALAGEVDDNGRVRFVPELRDVLLDERERADQAIKKMVNGTMRGDSRVAQPVSPLVQQQPRITPAPAANGAPAALTMTAQQLIPSFSDMGLTPTSWRQSEGLDAFVTMGDGLYVDGPSIEVVAECELLVIVYAAWHMTTGSGEIFVGVTAGNVDDGANSEMFLGSYNDETFPDSQWIGFSGSRSYHCVPGSQIQPHAFNLFADDLTLEWKLSVVRLEDMTERYPGAT